MTCRSFIDVPKAPDLFLSCLNIMYLQPGCLANVKLNTLVVVDADTALSAAYKNFLVYILAPSVLGAPAQWESLGSFIS